MEILFITICVLLVLAVSWVWASGIESMKNNHYDYKGEDFLDEKAPSWDDNKQHTENFN